MHAESFGTKTLVMVEVRREELEGLLHAAKIQHQNCLNLQQQLLLPGVPQQLQQFVAVNVLHMEKEGEAEGAVVWQMQLPA